MITVMVAYLLVALFFGLEVVMRRGKEAKTLTTGRADRGSTALIGVTYGIAIVGGPVVSYAGFGRTPHPQVVGWVGVGMMLAGLLVRAWAMHTLGQFYTRTLCVTEDHRIVQTGPYRLVRHPGYLGSILLWTGAGLASANWLITTAIFVVMMSVYTYRIRAEEEMLIAALGNSYRDYIRRTWRLVPFVH